MHADHPRSRGVYPGTPLIISPFSGSSPLARGLRHVYTAARGHGGIIPARAGFTVADAGHPATLEDHPRSRGVYVSATYWSYVMRGSSPLARGLRVTAVGAVCVCRIIPARAGFTCTAGRITASGRDHPRSRGVYMTGPRQLLWTIGSSPLARGLPPTSPMSTRAIRIIPARAGFTLMSLSFSRLRRDHPRSRGVYRSPPDAGRKSRGSSPLARGLPRQRPDHPQARGIIPARAGFTLRP